MSAKLVGLRRGGYCYEQNGLFAAILERLGYRVHRLAAETTTIAPEELDATLKDLGIELTDDELGRLLTVY